MDAGSFPRAGSGRLVAAVVLLVSVGIIFITGCSVLWPGSQNAQAARSQLVDDNVYTRNYATDYNHTYQLPENHVLVNCVDCHNNVRLFARLKATPQSCYQCHQKDDKHDGAYGQGCSECHNDADWKEAIIDHTKTSFPLTGKHITAACNLCHRNGVFQGTPDTCYSCHQQKDAHQGTFGQNCAECHNTNGWTPATYNRPHSFPKTHGKATACKTCHPNNLLTYSCYGCHKHTVANILRKHRNTQNLDDCVRCHPNGREKKGDN